jgi:hypothetical protein
MTPWHSGWMSGLQAWCFSGNDEFLEEKGPIGSIIIAQKEVASQHGAFQHTSPILAICFLWVACLPFSFAALSPRHVL